MNFKHGLCAALGSVEFCRRLLEKQRRARGIKPRKFTGLRWKELGHAEYMRQYRNLKRKTI